MKSPFLLLLLSLCATSATAQLVKDDYAHIIDTAIWIVRAPDTNHLKTVQEDLYLLDSEDHPLNYLHLPQSFSFKFIDIYSRNNKDKMIKGIHAWKVIPKLYGNRLTITIIDFGIRYDERNNTYRFANGGGYDVVFKYDCASNRWLFIDSNGGGI